MPAISFERLPVGICDEAVESGNAPVRWSPGKDRECIEVREEQQIGFAYIQESLYRGSIEGDAVRYRMLKLICHDGYVLLPPGDIAEGKADELYLVLRKQFPDILYVHDDPP